MRRARFVMLFLTLASSLATSLTWAQDAPLDEAAIAEQMDALRSIEAHDPAAAEKIGWLYDRATPPTLVTEDPDKSAFVKMQERIDGLFGEINGWLAPVLFFDVGFGVFDPDLDSVQQKLDDATKRQFDATRAHDDLATRLQERRQELGDTTGATPQDVKELEYEVERAARRVRITTKAVGSLDAMRGSLEAKADARATLLPRAREAKQAYAALPNNLRDPGLGAQLGTAYADIEGAAHTTIYQLPLIIVFLLLGGVFFTFRYGFINIRLFTHCLKVVRGKYDNPDDHGEVSHFQALTSALSATVGLGNIAGVAIAINQGGPGSVFWMWVVAFFGMSSKFSSCTLAQMYRRISGEAADHGAADDEHKPLPGKREHVLGGPMVYLSEGMKDVFGKTFGTPFGKALAILFAFFAIMGALGGGNMFQGNQTFAIVGDVLFEQRIENESALLDRVEAGDVAAATELKAAREAAAAKKDEMKSAYAWVGGLVMAALVGVVIVGGIKRIGEVTCRMVPAMCLFYVGVCLVIVVANFHEVPQLFTDIFKGAFSQEAMAWGGLMGVLVWGVKRGAFSNEAGLGSAAIAHSAAKTAEPVREGVVAMIGPFIDTHIVCTMTALAILITGAHVAGASSTFSNEGVGITATAFSTLAPWLSYLLTIAVFVFAYSTMISWSYYGERASEYLFGHHGIWPFRVVFLVFVFIAPMISLGNVLDFTDLLILSMAYPNILGMIFLSGKVARRAKDYAHRLRSGQMQMYDKEALVDKDPSI